MPRPSRSPCAKRYARALFGGMRDQESHGNAKQSFMKEWEKLFDFFDTSKDLTFWLSAPLASTSEKKAILGDICDTMGTSSVLRHFLLLLVSNKRFGDLRAIHESLMDEVDKDQGIVRGRVASAHDLDSQTHKSLEKTLSRLFSKEVHLTSMIDPSLMGGMCVTLGSFLYDATFKTRLKTLETVMKGSP